MLKTFTQNLFRFKGRENNLFIPELKSLKHEKQKNIFSIKATPLTIKNYSVMYLNIEFKLKSILDPFHQWKSFQ